MKKGPEFNCEYKEKSSIDLSHISFNFCSEEKIKDSLGKKLSDIQNKKVWIREHKVQLLENKDKWTDAVENGLITDDNPETIWKYKLEETKRRQERTVFIKQELENNIESIRKNVAENLSKFLPNWTAGKLNIDFTLNENADFCISGNNIIVDLWRLSFEEDFLKTTIDGITHEAFHSWMREGVYLSKAADLSLKEKVIFGIFDEGLAVLIGGQDLKSHHEKQGKNYEDFIKESFEVFDSFLKSEDGGKSKKIINNAFKNMGHAYVIGNEIVKAILKKEGTGDFKKLLENIRKNGPDEFLRIYNKMINKEGVV